METSETMIQSAGRLLALPKDDDNTADLLIMYSNTSINVDNDEFSFGVVKYRYDALPVTRSRNKASFCHSKTAKFIHLILFGVLLPTLCIVIPIYAKFILYADSVVTFGASDMRLVDGHMSTVWCQSQNVQMNASFDAYLMPETPKIAPRAQKLQMSRHFELDDDLKEYWGFYLLKGSEVTVSSCARYLGANVMLIKGISSLKFCAYVGQESREDVSSEILGLEGHKLIEQYQMATGVEGGTIDANFKAPSPPMFSQPNKKDKARIMQLIKARNEKRKIIKLLERENINTNNRNDSSVSTSVLDQVEEALQKILQDEIQSLYQEVKNIIFANPQNPANKESNPSVTNTNNKEKNKWPLRSPEKAGEAKLSAVITEDVDSMEDGAFEMADDVTPRVNLTADGIADDKGRIDHNHDNDTSQSDESSFSSSEEAMLHCNGVLLSQPLVPENRCSNETDPSHNVIKYTVEEDGYYYFIFSSANEKVRNQLTVKFELLKTIFNVTYASDVCRNMTDCHFPLHFYSSERVVVSLPAPESNNSREWDHTFVARSVCEPRMPLYLSFVLLLPLFIVLCAFR